jgi:hypothetical protein
MLSHVGSEANVLFISPKRISETRNILDTPPREYPPHTPPEKMLQFRPMEITSLKFPPMPGEYYRRQAARVRNLAQEATTLAIREHLADVVLQYEKLAEGAEAGYREPQ